ncbi:hypothetical protein RHS01_09156 [Rhizoctonia solani]|uniref:Uncharacterized protein n=1 Tax=Rhizoctonia solani TaxID=456999 RepID=A0A8H7I614_9AGAM|nr:hypothetical protein RHS01_09156 [Rhizoctonia solani]
MEPEPSPTALLEAITALTTTVGSLQDQIRARASKSLSLGPYAKKPQTSLGQRPRSTQSPAWPINWACHSSHTLGGETHTPGTVRPGLKDPFRPSRGTGFDSEEEEEPRQAPKKEPCGTPRSLSSLTPFDAGSSAKQPKMDLPDPYKGDIRGRKATQWLDQMLLWAALHREQFDEEEQMVKPCRSRRKRAAARKIAVLVQTTTTSEYVTEFRNLIAELDWNKEAYIAQFTRGLHWKVKELLSTKDNIPNKLEAIFAASIKIDNTRWENEENRPKRHPPNPRSLRPLPQPPPNGFVYQRTQITSPWKKGIAAAHQAMPEAPLIDWQQGLVTFPEQVQIASKEEADSDPLADLPPQYHEFAKVFGKEEFKVLPPHREYDISIDLVPDAKLTPGPIYGMTDVESKALKQHIDKELATARFAPAPHPLALQSFKQRHPQKRLPLPRQDDLMAKLQNAKLFTKLDLQWGYNNVRIKEGNKWKTAFRTKYGLFEYLVMPFGLTNAPAAFQHFMNNLFRDLIDVTVVIYLDNILIFSENPEDHPNHVREVLLRLMKNQLFCKLSKCYFHVTTVDYLGIVISPSGFSMDQKKIEAVTTWPTPKRAPLHNLTRKESPWSWDVLEEQAFQELKALVTKAPVLIHSNPNLPYYLETDASGIAMGAILSQQGDNNRLHPVAYMSKSFSGAEANYNTHDKELLAIIKALEEWRKQSGKPDALSRRSDYIDTPPEPEVMLPAEVFANTSEEEVEIVTEIRSRLREDPSLEPIIQFLTEDADNAPPSIQKAYRDYNWEEDLLWYQGKLVVPDSKTLKEQLLKEFHDSPLAGHPGQQRTLELLSRNYWWPGMKSSAKEWVECCPTCQANHQAHALVIALKPLEVPPIRSTPFPMTLLQDSQIWAFHPNYQEGYIQGSSGIIHFTCVETPWVTGQNSIGQRDYVHRKVPKGALPTPWGKTILLISLPPESDGQTERVNQFIEFYLRLYVAADHSDWASWLPLAEYAYNNARHSATGKTPFKLVYGQNPVMNPSNIPANVPEANHVADTLAQEWKEAEAALRMSKEKMAGNKGTIPEYSVGDKVWLDGKNVELRTNSNKLDPRRLGPFKITEKISSHAYCLKLQKP